jgi:cobalamin biosynthesis Co2+ chelatase CbiK
MEGIAFLKCKMVKKCWIALSIEYIRIDLLESTSAKDMVLEILSLQQEAKMKVICLLFHGGRHAIRQMLANSCG